tara:strand:+ start:2895 stop:3194 length:300 start_codon:yes stop_codon:yes gene_type:complete
MSKVRDLPLTEAIRIINADRNEEYGEPADNFQDIADMMTVLLKPILKDGAKVCVSQVAMTMIAVKLSRMTTSPNKFDTWVDIAGYVGAGWEATEKFSTT